MNLPSHKFDVISVVPVVAVMANLQYGREEVFESSGGTQAHWTENDATALFEEMQKALNQLVRKYEVNENESLVEEMREKERLRSIEERR